VQVHDIGSSTGGLRDTATAQTMVGASLDGSQGEAPGTAAEQHGQPDDASAAPGLPVPAAASRSSGEDRRLPTAARKLMSTPPAVARMPAESERLVYSADELLTIRASPGIGSCHSAIDLPAEIAR
jgi:hypothetical protein